MDGGSETIDFERFVKISLPYNNEIDVLKTYLTDKVAWFLNHENFSLEIWTGDIVRPGTMHEMINQRERLQNNTTRGYVGSGYFMSYHNNKSACVFGLDYTEVNYRIRKLLIEYFDNLKKSVLVSNADHDMK